MKNAKAVSDYSKYDPYLFNVNEQFDHKKHLLFKEWGQRISIRVAIPRKDTGEAVSYITGWMAYPNGEIRLNTPYGGK